MGYDQWGNAWQILKQSQKQILWGYQKDYEENCKSRKIDEAKTKKKYQIKANYQNL